MNAPSLWAFGDYNAKVEIQNLLFPDGILYYREFDDYRTTKINAPVFDLLQLASQLGLKKMDFPILLSKNPFW